MSNSRGKLLKCLVLISAVVVMTSSLTKTYLRDAAFVGGPKPDLQSRRPSKVSSKATSRQQESDSQMFQAALQKDTAARSAGNASAVELLLNVASCVFWALFIKGIFVEGYYAKYLDIQETLRTATVQGLGGVSVPLFPQGD